MEGKRSRQGWYWFTALKTTQAQKRVGLNVSGSNHPLPENLTDCVKCPSMGSEVKEIDKTQDETGTHATL